MHEIVICSSVNMSFELTHYSITLGGKDIFKAMLIILYWTRRMKSLMLIHLVLYQKRFEKQNEEQYMQQTPIHAKIRELYFFLYAQNYKNTKDISN